MDENPEAKQAAGMAGSWHRYRLLTIVLLIVVALGAAAIGWLAVSKDSAVKQAEAAAASQRAELIKQAEAQFADSVGKSLTQFGVPLGWAIRREMMANNLDQVDQYVTDLLREKGFGQVVVAKTDGSIVVASDRRNIGASFGSLYAERYLNAEQIIADERAPGQWLLVVPVMELNARLGTVAVEYQAPPFTLDK